MSDFDALLNWLDEKDDDQKPMKEDLSFSEDESNPYRIHLTANEMHPIQKELIASIEAVEQYSWSRGSRGGLMTGFPLFDQAIEGGLQQGIFLFAAQPNVGKSALLLQICKQTAELNQDVFVAYFSLDDGLHDLMPRFIACDQQLPISICKNPERYAEDIEKMNARTEGLKKLYALSNRFGMYDANQVGQSIENIEAKIEMLRLHLPKETKLVVAIDNFYDIQSDLRRSQDDGAKYEYTAGELKRISTMYDCPILCTAELRKLNGNRRPGSDDLRETVKLQYIANVICLLYNEVGIREQAAEIYWLNEMDEKKPVIECRIGKNKLGSFKGTIFFEFVPEYSYAMEVSQEDARRYASLLYG